MAGNMKEYRSCGKGHNMNHILTYLQSLLFNHLKKMYSRTCYLFACLAAVLLTFTVDAGYVSKKAHRKCHTEYETVTSYEKECSTVKDEHCKPKVEEVCNTVDVQECTLGHERVCTQHDDKQCSVKHEEQCTTVYDEECTTDYEKECTTTHEKECP